MFSSVKKLINKSNYNSKKHEFVITFKDKNIAMLVQILLGESTQRGKTVKVKVDNRTSSEQLLKLLELT